VFCALRADGAPSLERLAFFTLPEAADEADRPGHLQGSPEAAIDVIERFAEADRARAEAALDCYVTYQDVVEEHDPLGTVGDGVRFELFQETHAPPLDGLTAGLDGG